ncbi:molybdopterin-guanine dinucleotide biosynthesis protein B [Carnimonas nigrificans]|uniref:molybdopterin-guanine dinucleotide biosynthesis protein B n=1 Tax=Carnimonas nigrificans TaxID=64323 RepID=UPI0004B5A8C4|nr:molybdopterin-guanine dinucleotide biosynthesis protein B [Carnimonas nigrificans]
MLEATHHRSLPPVLGIAGFSGAGKTTLLEKLLPLLREAGEHCAVIKHAHHDVDVDTPGKDSYRLRKAGAIPMLLASAQRYAVMVETPESGEPCLNELIGQLLPHAPSLILVEGFKHADISRLEVFRAALHKPLLALHDNRIIAIAAPTAEEVAEQALLTAADAQEEKQCGINSAISRCFGERTLLPLDQPARIAQWVLNWASPQRELP